MSLAAIVLAGGAGTRFGSDKLAVDVDGRPLLHHALEACAAIVDDIVVVLAPGASVPEPPPSLTARILVAHDPVAHRGPLAGLGTGLESVTSADVVIVVGGDMPSLVPAVLQLMVDRLATEPALAVATLEDATPATLPLAVRPAAAVPVARTLLAADRRSLRSLIEHLPSTRIAARTWRSLDPHGATLADIDTPADLPARRLRG